MATTAPERPATRHHGGTLSQRICAFLLFAYIAEMIFGGALGLQPLGLPLRKLMMATMLVAYAAVLIGARPMRHWQLILVAVVMTLLLFWGGIIPLIQRTDLSYVASETMPLAGLLLALPMAQSMSLRGAEVYLRFANACVALVALVVIVVWALATFFDAPAYALGLKLFFVAVSGDDFGIYIGPMPDGSFRVMWITCILFPFMQFYKNARRFDLQWTAYYVLAAFATGTRTFLYVSLLVAGVTLVRRRPRVALMLVPVLAVAVVAFIQAHPDMRIFQVTGELDADSARRAQFFSLLRLLADHPLMGAGFGSHADVIRSEVAPFSYELTYVALLAKVGLLGILAIVTVVLLATLAAMRRHVEMWPEIITLILAFMLVTTTNPYLINSVGMSIVAFVIAVAFRDLPAPEGSRTDETTPPLTIA